VSLWAPVNAIALCRACYVTDDSEGLLELGLTFKLSLCNLADIISNSVLLSSIQGPFTRM